MTASRVPGWVRKSRFRGLIRGFSSKIPGHRSEVLNKTSDFPLKEGDLISCPPRFLRFIEVDRDSTRDKQRGASGTGI